MRGQPYALIPLIYTLNDIRLYPTKSNRVRRFRPAFDYQLQYLRVGPTISVTFGMRESWRYICPAETEVLLVC